MLTAPPSVAPAAASSSACCVCVCAAAFNSNVAWPATTSNQSQIPAGNHYFKLKKKMFVDKGQLQAPVYLHVVLT